MFTVNMIRTLTKNASSQLSISSTFINTYILLDVIIILRNICEPQQCQFSSTKRTLLYTQWIMLVFRKQLFDHCINKPKTVHNDNATS